MFFQQRVPDGGALGFSTKGWLRARAPHRLWPVFSVGLLLEVLLYMAQVFFRSLTACGQESFSRRSPMPWPGFFLRPLCKRGVQSVFSRAPPMASRRRHGRWAMLVLPRVFHGFGGKACFYQVFSKFLVAEDGFLLGFCVFSAARPRRRCARV